MTEPIRINDLIALRTDLPEHNLAQGRIGRVLQVFAENGFKIQFVNDLGESIAEIPLNDTQFRVLRYETTIDDTAFWHMIAEAKSESNGDSEREVQVLINKLAAMSIADIFAYDSLFHHYSHMAYRRELWAAAYIIGGGCSDDGFTDFRAWLIAQGEVVFHGALDDPETLLDLIDASDDLPDYDERLEEMNYVGSYAYEKKTGEEMSLFGGIYSMPKLTGVMWDDSMLCKMYPKLCAKFWPELCDEAEE